MEKNGKEEVLFENSPSKTSSSSSISSSSSATSSSKNKVVVTAEFGVFGANAIKSFSKMHNNSKLSDVILTYGDPVERFEGHKIILSIWSPKFKELLEKNVKDGKSEIPIQLEKNEVELFKMILLYIYTGTLQLISEQALPLLALAHKFGIDPLKEQCAEVMGENMSNDNVFYLLDICNKYQCHKLRVACASYMANNFQTLMKSGKALELDIDTCYELLRSDEVNAFNEEELFDWVLKYCDQSVEPVKTQNLEKLMPAIRFPLMKSSYLVQTVETDPKMKSLKNFHSLIHEAYKFKSYPKLVQNERTKDRKHSRPKVCKGCGKTYIERENNDGVCKRHRVRCSCPTPFQYYPNPVASPNCCCSGCRQTCQDCGSCKCSGGCRTGFHEEDEREEAAKWIGMYK